MISRNERGKLVVNGLDMSIMFDDLFEKCETENEVEWLNEHIIACIECSMQDKLDSLEN